MRSSRKQSRPSEEIAAVDLGSNSFHMVIARLVNGEPVIVDRLREPVRLAAGLDEEGRLDPEARERALGALRRFAQRLESVAPQRLRAVATNTFRAARSTGTLLRAAERALGHTIEVVSGHEEARLIYLGVAHGLPDDPGPRLVLDIGGGSTEAILGARFETLEAHSLQMGCVEHSKRFFPRGRIRAASFERAVIAAGLEVQTFARRFREIGWRRAVGASGTIRSVNDVLVASGWATEGITLAALKKLRKALLAAGSASRLDLPGLKPDRAAVFAGGVAILLALFDGLGIDRMETCTSALREGVLYDLLGRIRHEDVRERTIRVFQERYHVDAAQASRVERKALELFLHVAEGWGLDRVEDARYLAWAARLHEVGLAVSYDRYHAHGAYLVSRSDMPGFSQEDQDVVSAIVGSHRRKVSRRSFRSLPARRAAPAERLTVLLRLAVLLNRSRSASEVPSARLSVEGRVLRIAFPASWLATHPLTAEDLAAEARYLTPLGYKLRV